MTFRDPATRSRFWLTLALSMGVSLFCGFCGAFTPLVGLTMRRPFPPVESLLELMLIRGLNTLAVAFWIVFPILFLIHVPNYLRSEAAIDWDRRIKLAEEIFEREAKRRRRS